ncbi:MAG TPA: hypothetical protein VMA77_31895 [Solirubrobacteraceae bacterium]|nr:hypothetical protein [Solirubrobacteraceae bacterium]
MTSTSVAARTPGGPRSILVAGAALLLLAGAQLLAVLDATTVNPACPRSHAICTPPPTICHR